MSVRQRFLLLIFSFFGISQVAHADTIEYGDLTAADVIFTNVTEMSDADHPLFGTPDTVGNSLVFPNPQFALDIPENSFDFVDGIFSTTVVALDNRSIHSMELREFGNYLNFGSDVEVLARGAGFAITDSGVHQGVLQFQETAAGEGIWSGSFLIEFPDPVQSFTFVMDNQLLASAGAGSSAFIDKQRIRLKVTIPEPSTFAIFGVAAILGLARSRRRPY